MRTRRFYLGELTWPDVEEFLSDHDVVVVPVGSCEQHGPHLPLDTDAYDVFWLSRKAAEKSGCALVAPPIYYGVSPHHMDFPGTVTVSLTLWNSLPMRLRSVSSSMDLGR